MDSRFARAPLPVQIPTYQPRSLAHRNTCPRVSALQSGTWLDDVGDTEARIAADYRGLRPIWVREAVRGPNSDNPLWFPSLRRPPLGTGESNAGRWTKEPAEFLAPVSVEDSNPTRPQPHAAGSRGRASASLCPPPRGRDPMHAAAAISRARREPNGLVLSRRSFLLKQDDAHLARANAEALANSCPCAVRQLGIRCRRGPWYARINADRMFTFSMPAA